MGNRLYNEDEFGFIDDVVEVVSDGADAVGDVVTSGVDLLGDAVKAIPGGEWVIDGVDEVGGAVGDFVKGPLRDFARTPIGEVLIRAYSIALQNTVFIIPYVGYTLALMTLAIPGLAKGEEFVEAFVKETAYRIEQVIEYFAGDAGEKLTDAAKKQYNEVLSDQIRNAIETISQNAEAWGLSPQQWLRDNNMTPDKLAAHIGTRDDMAALAINWFNGDKTAIGTINDDYDLATGKKIKRLNKRKLPVAGASKAPSGPVDPCVSLAKAKAMGQNQAIINALTQKCNDYRKSKAGKMNYVSGALKALSAATQSTTTLNKRKLPTGKTTGPSTRTPCEIYDAAVKAGQKPVILAALKPKCDAYKAEMAAKAATLAASTAVSTAPVAMTTATESVFNSETNQKSAIAGVVSGAVGAGGALLAGLSAGIAIPVGLGFAAGGAIATKLLSKPKSAG